MYIGKEFALIFDDKYGYTGLTCIALGIFLVLIILIILEHALNNKSSTPPHTPRSVSLSSNQFPPEPSSKSRKKGSRDAADKNDGTPHRSSGSASVSNDRA